MSKFLGGLFCIAFGGWLITAAIIHGIDYLPFETRDVSLLQGFAGIMNISVSAVVGITYVIFGFYLEAK